LVDSSKISLSDTIPPAITVKVPKDTTNNEIEDFTILAGDLPLHIPFTGKPYRIKSDVFVPTGKICTIDPGVVFLFKNFTGMHVQGTLIVKGTEQRAVVFTSDNDTLYNPNAKLKPNPYDWNGIVIHEDAIGTDFQYITCRYSVYGINSLTRFFRILNGIFNDNGRSDVTVENIPQHVGVAQPYSYTLSIKNAAVDGVPVKILGDPDAARRNAFRLSGVGLFIAGAIAGTVFAVQMNAYQKKITTYNNDLFTYKSSDFTSAQKNRDLSAGLTAVCYGGGTIGAALFAMSFRF
jgi:hypothetical protein